VYYSVVLQLIMNLNPVT